MGTAISSASSPEPEDITSTAERLLQILAQKPLRMAQMLRLTRLINDCSPEEKRQLYSAGVVNRILDMIAELGQIGRSESTATGSPAAVIGEEKRRRPFIRRNSTLNAAAAAAAATNRGIGYGHGSTRSRWDIERTLEERLVREEHLIWLLNAITAYIFCANPDFAEIDWPKIALRDNQHLDGKIAMDIGESAIVALLEYHLKNDSVFDVSEHMELYQALLETASAMSLLPAFVPYLVRPYATDARSIAKELVPKFRDTMAQYPNTLKGQMGSPDFRLIDFINRIGHYADVIMSAARNYERDLPAEQRIRTAVAYRPRTTRSEATLARSMNDLREFSTSDDRSEPPDAGLLYTKALKHYQMQTARFIGDYGKLVVPFTFKKEVRNVNPFSPALKERTKRVAKELASMPNSLPLQTSNAIFVCVDEGRCDIMKVLISGPDDTPYQNGLFEFDVFFPTSYPFSPPKCAFLTTGSGNIRFNPNLYNDGKICLSILGTWEGRPEEKWNPYCSLLQVLISIQGLIFVKEPYFNEPGFEKHQGTDKGKEFSRKYNLQIQHATLTYAIREQIRSGPDYFKPVILRHFWLKRTAIIEQAQGWLAEVKRDTIAAAAAEKQNNKSHKETSSLTFEGACNPYAQERFIHQLIDELTNMTCPCDYCKISFFKKISQNYRI